MISRIIIFISLVAFSLTAQASSVKLYDEHIQLFPPVGYCEAGNQPTDSSLIEPLKQALGNGNKLLMAFADCIELEEYRDGKRDFIENYGQYLAQTPKGQLRKFEGVKRSEFLEAMNEILENKGVPLEEVEAKINQRLPDLNIELRQNLGLIGKDSNGLYTGMVAKMQESPGNYRQFVGVTSYTFVKEFAVSVNIYQTFDGLPNLRGLLALQREVTANYVKANE